eukprot:3750391-Rhodomonas_salina.1
MDINECDSGNGGCHELATCGNLDGTLRGGTHTCKCPSDMVGDGTTSCGWTAMTTIALFMVPNVTTEEVQAEAPSIVATL